VVSERDGWQQFIFTGRGKLFPDTRAWMLDRRVPDAPLFQLDPQEKWLYFAATIPTRAKGSFTAFTWMQRPGADYFRSGLAHARPFAGWPLLAIASLRPTPARDALIILTARRAPCSTIHAAPDDYAWAGASFWR